MDESRVDLILMALHLGLRNGQPNGKPHEPWGQRNHDTRHHEPHSLYPPTIFTGEMVIRVSFLGYHDSSPETQYSNVTLFEIHADGIPYSSASAVSEYHAVALSI